MLGALNEWLAAHATASWLVPVYGLLVTAIIALIRVWPKLREIGVSERVSIRDPYLKRIKELSDAVERCRRECDKQEERLRGTIDKLQARLNNEAWQRIQSEISLVHTLIQVVDAPELKAILGALEKRRASLPAMISVLTVEEGNDNDD